MTIFAAQPTVHCRFRPSLIPHQKGQGPILFFCSLKVYFQYVVWNGKILLPQQEIEMLWLVGMLCAWHRWVPVALLSQEIPTPQIRLGWTGYFWRATVKWLFYPYLSPKWLRFTWTGLEQPWWKWAKWWVQLASWCWPKANCSPLLQWFELNWVAAACVSWWQREELLLNLKDQKDVGLKRGTGQGTIFLARSIP